MMIIDGYTIDCEISGDPTFENEATEYPVEKGADVTDHVHSKQLALSCEGIISDSPIGDVRVLREYDQITGGTDAFADAAHAHMIKIHTDRLPVNVTCSIGSFDNMILLSYAPKRVGDSIQFTATFRQLAFVTNDRQVIRVAVPRAKKKAMFRNLPTGYNDERGRAIFRTGVKSGPNKGTSIYTYADGTPVPEAQVDKAYANTGAVRVKYVNGKAVPVHDENFQPYNSDEQPWWPDDDVPKVPAIDPGGDNTFVPAPALQNPIGNF